jgi:putative FmdB family regulatory protein
VPTYVYKCENGHTFEVLQSMSEDSLDTCETCGAPAQRVLFAPAVHFKGSGFYTTDYARKGKNKVGGSDSGSDSSGGDSKGSESKSDSGSGSSGGNGNSKSKSSDTKSGSGSSSSKGD